MGVILLLILLVLVAMLIASVAIALKTKRPTADGGACGRCGYNVRGVASLTCPECGADLREVGIVGDRRAGAGRFIAAAVLWLVPVTAFGLVGAAVGSLRRGFAHSADNAAAGQWIALVSLAVMLVVNAAGVWWITGRMRAPKTAALAALGFWLLVMLLLAAAFGLRW